MKRINVHIGTLRVHGVGPGEHHRVAMGLEEELARLLGEAGFAEHLSRQPSRERLAVASCSVPADSSPEGIGARVARGIAGSLRR
jgi:hypothetical protein